MAARLVQTLMDLEVLDRIDTDPEVRERGRSAFIRTAGQLYLQAEQRREVEVPLAQAYAGHANALLEEVGDRRSFGRAVVAASHPRLKSYERTRANHDRP